MAGSTTLLLLLVTGAFAATKINTYDRMILRIEKNHEPSQTILLLSDAVHDENDPEKYTNETCESIANSLPILKHQNKLDTNNTQIDYLNTENKTETQYTIFVVRVDRFKDIYTFHRSYLYLLVAVFSIAFLDIIVFFIVVFNSSVKFCITFISARLDWPPVREPFPACPCDRVSNCPRHADASTPQSENEEEETSNV